MNGRSIKHTLPCLKFGAESGRQSSLEMSISSFSLVYQSEKLYVLYISDTVCLTLKDLPLFHRILKASGILKKKTVLDTKI